MSKENITFDQLMELIGRGIIGPKAKPKRLAFGFRGGCYLGSPGKDVFLSLPFLSDEEIKTSAYFLADQFPKKPISNHVHTAACIRYIYGCFEKQGSLRSKKDKQRMITENQNWDLPIKFINHMVDKFTADDNKYGLIIHYEMFAHRIGDRAVIESDVSKLQEMMYNYIKCYKIAKECKCYKHIFTPFYWGASYYYEMGQYSEAKDYYVRCLKYMERYCPDARDGYREKASIAISRVLSLLSPQDKTGFLRWVSKCKNKVIKKVRGKFV